MATTSNSKDTQLSHPPARDANTIRNINITEEAVEIEELRSPPPRDPGTLAQQLMPADGYSFYDWLKLLETDPNAKTEQEIFTKGKKERYSGLGRGAREIFRTIATNLRNFHKAELFCGDVIGRTVITLPSLEVKLLFSPLQANMMYSSQNMRSDEISLFEGIKGDLLDFRMMVGMVVKTYIKPEDLCPDLKFFFSKIFIEGIENMAELLEISCYQLFHPAFYNEKDRQGFFTLANDYRDKAVQIFDMKLQLKGDKYGLEDWRKKCSHRALHKALSKVKGFKQDSQHAALLRFLRNVHEHFNEYGKWKFHCEVDLELENLFPGACSKILDGIIRHLRQMNDAHYFIQYFEKLPSGFESKKFWNPRKVSVLARGQGRGVGKSSEGSYNIVDDSPISSPSTAGRSRTSSSSEAGSASNSGRRSGRAGWSG